MAGGSYLFFLTVWFFFRRTIAVAVPIIETIDSFEKNGLSIQTGGLRRIAVEEVLEFRVGVLLEPDSGRLVELNIQFGNPWKNDSSPLSFLVFSYDQEKFKMSESRGNKLKQILEYPDKEVYGFIVRVEVKNGGTKCQIKYYLTLYCAVNGAHGITSVMGGPYPSRYPHDIEYVIKEVSVSTYSTGHIFLDDGTEFVKSPSHTNLSELELMRTLDIIKLKYGNRENLIVRAFPDPRDGPDDSIAASSFNIQFYDKTEENEVVGDIYFFNLTLNGTRLTIVGSFGDTTLDLNGTFPDGILVQFSFSKTAVQYVMNVYKYGECIGTVTGEMKNGGGNRIILTSKNFIYSSNLGTFKLPELQSSKKTIQKFKGMSLSIIPDVKRYIIFNGEFSLGYILRILPGMACSFSLMFGLSRSQDINKYGTSSKDLYINFNGTRIVADPSSTLRLKTTVLDVTGMNVDGFTVSLKMHKNETRYEVTPYSGGQSFNGKVLQGVLWGFTTPDYDCLSVTIFQAGTFFYHLDTQYGAYM